MLYCAVERGFLEMVTILLDKGADLDHSNNVS